MTFENFATWPQLLDHVRAGYPLWYQAPMDYRPSPVFVVVRKDGKIRVYPSSSDVDPFTADGGHLSRFRRTAERRVS